MAAPAGTTKVAHSPRGPDVWNEVFVEFQLLSVLGSRRPRELEPLRKHRSFQDSGDAADSPEKSDRERNAVLEGKSSPHRGELSW
jgi:hypothetical protein